MEMESGKQEIIEVEYKVRLAENGVREAHEAVQVEHVAIDHVVLAQDFKLS